MFDGYVPEDLTTSANAMLTDAPLAAAQDSELRDVIKRLQRGEVIPNYSLSK
jgi:hypothetical protein